MKYCNNIVDLFYTPISVFIESGVLFKINESEYLYQLNWSSDLIFIKAYVVDHNLIILTQNALTGDRLFLRRSSIEPIIRQIRYCIQEKENIEFFELE